jgi:6-phosphogluconolactonase
LVLSAGANLFVGDRSAVQQAVVSDFQDAARAAIDARGVFLVAVAGGSIAPLCFPALAALALDWSRVDFFQVDERAVPPDHPDSNFGEVDRLWLKPAGVPADRVHRMRGEDTDLRAASEAYGVELQRVAGSPPALDFVLLGVGTDGHIASLFPGHAALKEQAALVVPMDDAPKPPPRRITLTMPVLAGAVRILVMAAGEGKAEVVRQALEPGSPLPLGLLVSRAGNVRVLLVK